MKVLIVDDDNDIRAIARMSLSRIGGMDVVEASNGTDAVERAGETRFDAILLDFMMPDMDGPATFRRLRENPASASTPVIFLTAKVMPSETKELIEMGASGVLAKPFDPVELPRQLRELIARASATGETS